MTIQDYWKRIKDMLFFHTSVGDKIVSRDCEKLHKYYSVSSELPRNPVLKKQIIFMVDGRTEAGGLCDRFRGIISTYQWAQQNGFDFRIHYISPIRLEDYLVPKEYDWRIDSEDVSYNSDFSKPIYLHSESNNFQKFFFRRMLRKHIRGNYYQYHVYSNILAVSENYFRHTFKKLFALADPIQREIDSHLGAIGGEYIALSFRFQQLLGDFKDGAGDILSEEDRQKIIEKNLTRLQELKEETGAKIVLVCSDSVLFTKAASKFDYVYVIPGEIAHIDYCYDQNFSLHLKTFVDFFMISHAERVYLLATGKMYPQSAFAQFAAWIEKKPFKLIRF